jgi:hypothetical protein
MDAKAQGGKAYEQRCGFPHAIFKKRSDPNATRASDPGYRTK